MTGALCDSCRDIFSGNENDNRLADLIEAAHPACRCEAVSVGTATPGPVADHEVLLRIIISPRDVDELGQIAVRPFEKAFQNGLSVCRNIAADEQIEELARDGLRAATTNRVVAVLTAAVADLRSLNSAGERIFCIYDQTVSRPDAESPPIPSHGGIFQRLPPKGIDNRKSLQKDFARMLHQQFVAGRKALDEFRDGFLQRLNDHAT